MALQRCGVADACAVEVFHPVQRFGPQTGGLRVVRVLLKVSIEDFDGLCELPFVTEPLGLAYRSLRLAGPQGHRSGEHYQ